MKIRYIYYKLVENDYREFFFDELEKEDHEMLMNLLNKYEYQLVKHWDGYIIKHQAYDSKHSSYVSKVKKNGDYEFHSDYTYAKSFKDKKTAQKHLDIIREKARKGEL